MKTNHLFASAAVAAVLVMTAPAHAQIVGGAVRGGTAGAFAGSFGGIGGMGSANGRVRGGTDTSLYGNMHARRAVDAGARDAAKASAHAAGSTTTAVRDGRETGESVGRTALTSAADEVRETPPPAVDATAATAATAAVAGTDGNAVAGASGNAQPASRPSNYAQSSGRAPAHNGSSGTQSAEKPRPGATQANASASVSADASAGASRAQ